MNDPVLKLNQFQKSEPLNGFYVNSFSNHIAINKKLISKPHRHNFYLCVLFTQGSGTHEIDFNSHVICPGKVFFLRPGQTHSWRFDTKPEGFIFFHSKEFYEMQFLDHKLNTFPFFHSFQNPPALQLSPQQIEPTSKLLATIFAEYQRDDLLRNLKIVSLINTVYIDFTREYTAAISVEKVFSSRYLKLLEHLEHLINENFKKEKLPKFYAERLHITTKHLNRVVRETVNKTTSELISERIILEAKRLIVNSDESFTLISDSLEFSDHSYFSKLFKSRTGITPMDFRKKYAYH